MKLQVLQDRNVKIINLQASVVTPRGAKFLNLKYNSLHPCLISQYIY